MTSDFAGRPCVAGGDDCESREGAKNKKTKKTKNNDQDGHTRPVNNRRYLDDLEKNWYRERDVMGVGGMGGPTDSDSLVETVWDGWGGGALIVIVPRPP